ncbi:PLP-dependent aminotransferase family protein [Dyella caseinilytica]|uniref:PLP-dependent aminotransferase family protein n=1 Tax=Dyella caseinilytica TaxID=1849581 RepID=A0ABX7H090_9GAMM|nr:PLP-dependent aminotransferase family protein [Dyella caseinilytica]QRN55980.1 PLP-dependent aminotransferase family protein [Dyella caseinilytica]GGA11575.1 transcriptional regulator [Dyella caseinilytica]
MLLYEQLASQLREQIAQGALRAGERLPSIRQLARSHGVSTATAVQACLQLEREGLAQARPRSGYFVRAATPQTPSLRPPRRRTPATVSNPMLQDVLDMLARSDLLPLHSATAAPELLPQSALTASLSHCLRHAPAAALDYAPPQGHPALHRMIAQRYAQLGVSVSPDEIIITAGAMEAISLALRTVTTPGDVVLVESPTYHGILQAIAALQLKVLEVPNVPGGGIDVARLDQRLQQNTVRAAVLVPNFNNPLGSLTDDAAKQAILASCAKHKTIVIEDDIYGELSWSGQRPSPMRRWDRHGNVITCSSFSKILSPGLRIGWLVGSEWTDALLRAKYFSTVGGASLPQLALVHYLQRHDLERHLRRLRMALADNGQRLHEAIERYWPKETRACTPRGGLSLWTQLPPDTDVGALFETALAEGIGTSPGMLFSSRGDYADCLRLSCGLPWSDKLDRALQRLGRLARDKRIHR